MAQDREDMELALGEVDCIAEPIRFIGMELDREVRFDEPARTNLRDVFGMLLGCSRLARDSDKGVAKLTRPIAQDIQAALAALSDTKKGPRESIDVAHKHVHKIERRLPEMTEELRARVSQLRMREMAGETEIVEPRSREQILSAMQAWLKKLEQAIIAGEGVDMCEATRMILVYGALLHAYQPDKWTRSLAKEAVSLFKRAHKCIRGILERGENPDGQYEDYERNTGDRLDNLLSALPRWCPEWSNDRHV